MDFFYLIILLLIHMRYDVSYLLIPFFESIKATLFVTVYGVFKTFGLEFLFWTMNKNLGRSRFYNSLGFPTAKVVRGIITPGRCNNPGCECECLINISKERWEISIVLFIFFKVIKHDCSDMESKMDKEVLDLISQKVDIIRDCLTHRGFHEYKVQFNDLLEFFPIQSVEPVGKKLLGVIFKFIDSKCEIIKDLIDVSDINSISEELLDEILSSSYEEFLLQIVDGFGVGDYVFENESFVISGASKLEIGGGSHCVTERVITEVKDNGRSFKTSETTLCFLTVESMIIFHEILKIMTEKDSPIILSKSDCYLFGFKRIDSLSCVDIADIPLTIINNELTLSYHKLGVLKAITQTDSSYQNEITCIPFYVLLIYASWNSMFFLIFFMICSFVHFFYVLTENPLLKQLILYPMIFLQSMLPDLRSKIKNLVIRVLYDTNSMLQPCFWQSGLVLKLEDNKRVILPDGSSTEGFIKVENDFEDLRIAEVGVESFNILDSFVNVSYAAARSGEERYYEITLTWISPHQGTIAKGDKVDEPCLKKYLMVLRWMQSDPIKNLGFIINHTECYNTFLHSLSPVKLINFLKDFRNTSFGVFEKVKTKKTYIIASSDIVIRQGLGLRTDLKFHKGFEIESDKMKLIFHNFLFFGNLSKVSKFLYFSPGGKSVRKISGLGNKEYKKYSSDISQLYLSMGYKRLMFVEVVKESEALAFVLNNRSLSISLEDWDNHETMIMINNKVLKQLRMCGLVMKDPIPDPLLNRGPKMSIDSFFTKKLKKFLSELNMSEVVEEVLGTINFDQEFKDRMGDIILKMCNDLVRDYRGFLKAPTSNVKYNEDLLIAETEKIKEITSLLSNLKEIRKNPKSLSRVEKKDIIERAVKEYGIKAPLIDHDELIGIKEKAIRNVSIMEDLKSRGITEEPSHYVASSGHIDKNRDKNRTTLFRHIDYKKSKSVTSGEVLSESEREFREKVTRIEKKVFKEKGIYSAIGMLGDTPSVLIRDRFLKNALNKILKEKLYSKIESNIESLKEELFSPNIYMETENVINNLGMIKKKTFYNKEGNKKGKRYKAFSKKEKEGLIVVTKKVDDPVNLVKESALKSLLKGYFIRKSGLDISKTPGLNIKVITTSLLQSLTRANTKNSKDYLKEFLYNIKSGCDSGLTRKLSKLKDEMKEMFLDMGIGNFKTYLDLAGFGKSGSVRLGENEFRAIYQHENSDGESWNDLIKMRNERGNLGKNETNKC